MHFIEVVLAPSAYELSEVRHADRLVRWFHDRDEALAFAAHYAAALERQADPDGKAFVSVCRPDGTWVPLSSMG